MEPKVYPITIKRGADFNLELQLLDESDKPVDLSNYAWRAQLRERPEAELFYDFTISTIPSLGKVSLFMPYALTDQIMFSNGVYDLYYVGLGNQVECLMHGSVSIGWKVTDMNETPVPLPYEPLKTLDVVNGGTGANNPADARKNLGITTGLDILAHYATAEELEEAVPYPAAGDAYMVGIAAPYDIYIWDGVHKEWLNAGNAIGAKGEKGDAAFSLGIGTVSTGEAGSNASVTNIGTSEDQVWNITIPKGSKGEAAFTLDIGTVTTVSAGSSAAVTNVGTTTDQIWNIAIPKGSDGQDGQPGQPGQPGQDGQDAVVTYETNPANIKPAGSASVGVLDSIPRADHVHPLGTIPISNGGTGQTTSGNIDISKMSSTELMKQGRK